MNNCTVKHVNLSSENSDKSGYARFRCVTVPRNLLISTICRLCSQVAQSGDHSLDNGHCLQIRGNIM